MGMPAARVTDLHTCPMVTGLVPHVGGPILPPCAVNVLIGNLPAARVGDLALCAGGPDTIVKGSLGVFINGQPAARIGDLTVHGGVITTGLPTVLIGDTWSGGGGGLAPLPPSPTAPKGGSPAPPQTPTPGSTVKAALVPATESPKIQKALSLIKIAGTADQTDASLVAKELAKLSDADLDRLKTNGSTVVVCRGSVTEHRTDLKGVQPRGWPAGKTWDAVPGLHNPPTKEVIVSTIGHGTPAGARVPQTGEGHGSANAVLHEVGHALDLDGSPPPLHADTAFQKARNQDLSSLTAYQTQAGEAGLQETFAEGLAKSIEGKSSGQPNLDAFFKAR